MIRRFALFFVALLALLPVPAAAERVRDLGQFQSVRSNQLTGYGIVVALDGSGEIWCAPNPKVRLQANWSMGRTKDTSLQFVPEGVSSQ